MNPPPATQNMTSEMPPMPSFEPWLGRVRALRAAAAGAGMLLGTGMAVTNGTDWVDAVLRGMGASVVMFFLGWAGSLWICSELYGGQVREAREVWKSRQQERQRHIQELYVKRMHMLADSGLVDAGSIEDFAAATMPMQPPPSVGHQQQATQPLNVTPLQQAA